MKDQNTIFVCIRGENSNVDDILLEEVINSLKNKFQAKDFGEINNYLGITIERKESKLKLQQTAMIEKI